MTRMISFLKDLRAREKAMLALLERLVCAESPSDDKAAVDRLGEMVAAGWRKRGAQAGVIRQKERGNHWRVEMILKPIRGEPRPRGQILILGHLDTVYPTGTLRRMPFRVSRGRAWGPGTFDMKGGLVMALFAAEALRRSRVGVDRRLVFLWTSDEEVGSETSRAIIEREAARSVAVLVLEPAAGRQGKLKTARKGVGEIELIVRGRSAHSGLDPETGVNAVHEMALQLARVMSFNDERRGIGVQANVIQGGNRTNVIPEEAHAQIDLRIARLSHQGVLERRFRALKAILPGARLEIRGGINRPPLERTAKVAALFSHARQLARQIGIDLQETAVGGGSDGNFTGALGIPTLDGLGAVGEGAHSRNENVLIRALPERAALLAGLLATL